MTKKIKKLPQHLKDKILTFCDAFGLDSTADVLKKHKMIKIPDEYRPEVLKLLEIKKNELANEKNRDHWQINNVINKALAGGYKKTQEFIELFQASVFKSKGQTEHLFTKTLGILYEIRLFQLEVKREIATETMEEFKEKLFKKTAPKPENLPNNLKQEIVKLWVELGPNPRAQLIAFMLEQDLSEAIKKQVIGFIDTEEFKQLLIDAQNN